MDSVGHGEETMQPISCACCTMQSVKSLELPLAVCAVHDCVGRSAKAEMLKTVVVIATNSNFFIILYP